MTSVIFDIDGTLTNTTAIDDLCYTRAFKTVFGVDIHNQNWSEITHVTDWGITEELVHKHLQRFPTPSEYKSIKSTFVSLLKAELDTNKNQFQEIPGAVNFIETLKRNNVLIGIATGGWKPSAILKLETIGITASDFAFSSCDDSKDRASIVLNTVHQIKNSHTQPLKKVVYFGDGIWDYHTCKDLGIDFIGIDHSNTRKLNTIGAEIVFENFNNIETLLRILKL